jgi:aspartyl protease family protein
MTRIILTLLIACMTTCAHAQLFKCKHADGSSTFQDIACPDGTTSSKIAAAAAVSAESLTLTPDSNGHYHSIVSINNVTVTGMIDTGATSLAVSSDLARTMGISMVDARPVNTQTANGMVVSYVKTMPMVKLGNVDIYNVEISVAPGVPTLIGMSVLKKFKISEDNGQMLLQKK